MAKQELIEHDEIGCEIFGLGIVSLHCGYVSLLIDQLTKLKTYPINDELRKELRSLIKQVTIKLNNWNDKIKLLDDQKVDKEGELLRAAEKLATLYSLSSLSVEEDRRQLGVPDDRNR